ncbi:THO complex subunit 6 homolog [Pocillopora verrucosa]|uniref:THO complex subunit 6 homolog n=1 Tax=Pocillopora verrucosa TaxID=203993 RepID=UPI0033408FF2
MAADSQSQIYQKRLELHTIVFAVAFSPCGNFLAACNNFGQIAVFSITSALAPDASSDKKRPVIFFQGHSNPIYSLISTDKFLISGGSSEIHGWRWDEILDKTEAPSPAWTLQPPAARASLDIPETNALAFSEQEDTLFSGCGDNNIYMWDLESGTCKNTLSGHSDYIQCLTLRTKHGQCVSGAEDGTVRLWDYRTKGSMTDMIEPCKNEDIHRPHLGSWIGCVAVDEGEDWLVCGGGPSLSVWHLRSMNCTSVLKTASSQQSALFHDDLILSAGSEPTVFHWQINGDPKTHVPCTPNSVFTMQINDQSPKNKVLAVGGCSADIDVFTNFGYKALSFKFSQ